MDITFNIGYNIRQSFIKIINGETIKEVCN